MHISLGLTLVPCTCSRQGKLCESEDEEAEKQGKRSDLGGKTCFPIKSNENYFTVDFWVPILVVLEKRISLNILKFVVLQSVLYRSMLNFLFGGNKNFVHCGQGKPRTILNPSIRT